MLPCPYSILLIDYIKHYNVNSLLFDSAPRRCYTRPSLPGGVEIADKPLYTDRYIDCNGLRLHYLDWGNEQAAPLVLLHGIHGHAHTWDRFASAMRGDFHVLALDLRGHGDSQWHANGAYGGQDYLTDLSVFANQAGLERFYLIGESLGGLIAFAFAAMNPGAIERLVIVDIGPEIASEGMGDIRQSTHTRPADFADMEEAVHWTRSNNPTAQETEVRQRLQHNLAPTPEGRLRWKYDPAIDALIQSGESQAAALLWQLWCAITCPTLIMRGENSALLSPETAQEMEARAANAQLVEIPKAGHAILWDNPEVFQDTAAGFLMRHPGA